VSGGGEFCCQLPRIYIIFLSKIKSTFCRLVFDITGMTVWYTFIFDYEYVVIAMFTAAGTDCIIDDSVYSCWY